LSVTFINLGGCLPFPGEHGLERPRHLLARAMGPHQLADYKRPCDYGDHYHHKPDEDLEK
jgi:hypothetical protein